MLEGHYKYTVQLFAGIFQCHGGKLEKAGLQMCFRHLLCVRNEIDQL